MHARVAMASVSHTSSAGAIKVLPIEGKTFGAFVTGVKLTNLTAEERKVIQTAFHEHALLVFPEQFLSDEERVGFARMFGDKFEYEENHFGNRVPNKTSINHRRAGSEQVLKFDLEDLKDKVVDNGSNREHFAKIQLATQTWHSDSTYTRVSAKAGLLSAKVVPSSGGGTGFADMRAAYDALDDSMKDRLWKLRAYHSNLYSDANDVNSFPPAKEDSYTFHPRAYLRPLVKVHPVTGRRSLQIGRHAFGVPGLSHEESAKLLKGLVNFACQGARVYEHTYKVGDVVIWDNRCTMHRGIPYDYSEPRTLGGTRISGDPSTEGALETPDEGRGILAEEMKRIRVTRGLPAIPLRAAL